MNNLIDNEDSDDANGRRDREITLGTSTVLGIFFGLAILCAAFFGFGYSLGSKHSAPSVTASGDPQAHSFFTVKPSPGSPIGSAAKPIPAVPGSSATEIKPPAAPLPGGCGFPSCTSLKLLLKADLTRGTSKRSSSCADASSIALPRKLGNCCQMKIRPDT